MSASNSQSPVLLEQSSPPPYPHNPASSSIIQLPPLSELLNELTSPQMNTDSSSSQSGQSPAMDGHVEPPMTLHTMHNQPAEAEAASAESGQANESDNELVVEGGEASQDPGEIPTNPSDQQVVEVGAEQPSPPISNAILNQLFSFPATTQIEESTEPSSTSHSTEPHQDLDTEESMRNIKDEVPSWVKYDEDMSVPDDEETKEIEGSEYDKLSALDIGAMEEQFYTDIEDPEQRPVKKLRLSWVIKGVRGTRERPNFARVMNSPGACVDGLYWSIKFYPRGDNCSSLSAFVRCSKEPPPVDEECPESDFSFFEGSPDTDLAVGIKPKLKMSVPARDRPNSRPNSSKEEEPEPEELKKPTDVAESENTSSHTPPASLETSDTLVEKSKAQGPQSWRVSAQLGMAIYNPAEPRTGHLQSDGHQFSRHCDDWGWVNFVGPWDEIHRRKRGQRQALLRNDTLAIDAYIRIYDDPTEALWWHESKDENQWPSKELAGYFSMGTPGLYHSPAVAGITAWMLLTPFRKILQSADGGRWRTDSNFNPMPLVCQSQLVLDQMCNLSSDCYVNLYKIIEEFLEVDESFYDVKTFWEVFRRGLELELANDTDALHKLSSIFDANGTRWEAPSLPVLGLASVQQGLAELFDDTRFNGPLPDFMPVMLNRSKFDTKIREWKLMHDRVRLDDQLDLSKWCTDSDPTYTLYGFIAHVGVRSSGKFYSVLRPSGVGTKWLAFEDGNGNKVFSYSKKRIQEYEGLEGEELRKFPAGQTRENAYMAMYIRSSRLEFYLTGSLEPYKVPKWLKPWADDPGEDDDDDDESQLHQEIVGELSLAAKEQDEDGLQIELYLDECAEGCENMLRLHDLRTSQVAREMCRKVTVATDKTFKELRCAIARAFDINDHSKIQMWEIHYQGLGKFSRAILEQISYRRKIVREAIPGHIFRLWISVQQPMGDNASYKQLLDRLNDLDLAKKAVEEDSTMEDVDAERLAAMTDAAAAATAEQESRPTTEFHPVGLNESTTSGPDAEQESVQAAVAADIEHASGIERTDAEIDVTIIAASTEQSESSEGEDDVLTPTSSARSVSLGPETASINHSAETSSQATAGQTEDDTTLAVVHGHLVEATQGADINANVVVTHVTAHVPHGDATALAQVLAEETISIDETSPAQEINEAAIAQTERESQNRTPTQLHVPRAYGNIQIFDADHQKFIAQRPFHPELEIEIGTAVKKQMGYSDDRQFRIWRRHGSTGTELVQPNTSFVSAGLSDVFTLIVGDVLSEVKVEELRLAGKFWQPQKLMAYLGMLKRKHPFAALTSTQPVELADFGMDHYRGPMSRGRPHGEQGFLVTSTGHTYEGPFVAGQKSGSNGMMTYQNGDTYVGEWLSDERHGQGEYVEKRTGNRYVGGFENGKRWGQGTTYWQVADQQAAMCQICYEEEIDALFYDCGHVCACVMCAKQCDTCPICRRSVRQVVKMYRA